MKKWTFLFLAAGSLLFGKEVDQKEQKAKELCSFTTEVFQMLSQKDIKEAYATSVKNLHKYERDTNPEIADLAKKFIASSEKDTQSKEAMGEAVSSLGRLFKCSVDDLHYRNDTSFVLHKGDIQKELTQMETILGERLPQEKHANYHKLMIESLADEHYDLALYSYLKIAEGRCQK